MKAMQLDAIGHPLRLVERPTPEPGPGQVLVEVCTCAVCRTDLHVVDGDLTHPNLPLVPGHEVVGHIVAHGRGTGRFAHGARVGIPWLGHTCGTCAYCRSGRENLCDHPAFTGYQMDGGFATHALAFEDYCVPIPDRYDDQHAAPLLCAGLIGYRSLKMTGDARRIGIYGFGAAAHIVAQVARHEGREVSPSPAAGIRRPSSSRYRSAAPGPAGRRSVRPRRSTPPSSSRQSARWFPPRSARRLRAARSCSAASI